MEMEAPMSLGPGEIEPSQSHGGAAPLFPRLAPASRVTFDRRELNRILGLYGRRVAAAPIHASRGPYGISRCAIMRCPKASGAAPAMKQGARPPCRPQRPRTKRRFANRLDPQAATARKWSVDPETGAGNVECDG